MNPKEDGPGLTFLGKLILFLFIAACGVGAWWLIQERSGGSADNGENPSQRPGSPAPTSSSVATGGGNDRGADTTIRIAYGTEKKRWLIWAVSEFEKTRDGEKIAIDLLPKGSLEGARATIDGQEKIHVWSPASSAYRNVFVDEWQLRYGGKNPIAREETLALSPMVFVFWKGRHDAFVSHYQQVDFHTIATALHEPGGWGAIANKPEWGFFKFGHTNPNESNSGLLSLALMSHHFHDKTEPLVMADIVDPAFQQWLKQIEGSVSGLSNSTGNMMRDMVLKGPASFDSIFVYENVAIDYLKNAEGRWGALQVVYPKINLWNDNPYYIIDAEWTSKDERKAAETFLEFLMSEPVQQQSLAHGFRPGNPAIPIKGPESPFTLYSKYGLQIDLPSIAELETDIADDPAGTASSLTESKKATLQLLQKRRAVFAKRSESLEEIDADLARIEAQYALAADAAAIRAKPDEARLDLDLASRMMAAPEYLDFSDSLVNQAVAGDPTPELESPH